MSIDKSSAMSLEVYNLKNVRPKSLRQTLADEYIIRYELSDV